MFYIKKGSDWMIYGYHRTSTREQHLDRGIAEITKYCQEHNMKLEKVYTDQQTGKNFERARYIVLTEVVLRTGDILIITEIDMLVSIDLIKMDINVIIIGSGQKKR